MKVVVSNGNTPWYVGALGNAAGAGLSALISGMFERDSSARKKNRFNQEWAAYQNSLNQQDPYTMTVSSPESEAIAAQAQEQKQFAPNGSDLLSGVELSSPAGYTPKVNFGLTELGQMASYNVPNAKNQVTFGSPRDINRAVAYGNLGRYVSPENVELAMKLAQEQYGNEFKLQDADAVKGRLGDLPAYNDRQGMSNYIMNSNLYGGKDLGAAALDTYKAMNPNLTSVNLKDRNVFVDPQTGKVISTQRMGVDPEQAMRIREGARQFNMTNAYNLEKMRRDGGGVLDVGNQYIPYTTDANGKRVFDTAGAINKGLTPEQMKGGFLDAGDNVYGYQFRPDGSPFVNQGDPVQKGLTPEQQQRKAEKLSDNISFGTIDTKDGQTIVRYDKNNGGSAIPMMTLQTGIDPSQKQINDLAYYNATKPATATHDLGDRIEVTTTDPTTGKSQVTYSQKKGLAPQASTPVTINSGGQIRVGSFNGGTNGGYNFGQVDPITVTLNPSEVQNGLLARAKAAAEAQLQQWKQKNEEAKQAAEAQKTADDLALRNRTLDETIRSNKASEANAAQQTQNTYNLGLGNLGVAQTNAQTAAANAAENARHNQTVEGLTAKQNENTAKYNMGQLAVSQQNANTALQQANETGRHNREVEKNNAQVTANNLAIANGKQAIDLRNAQTAEKKVDEYIRSNGVKEAQGQQRIVQDQVKTDRDFAIRTQEIDLRKQQIKASIEASVRNGAREDQRLALQKELNGLKAEELQLNQAKFQNDIEKGKQPKILTVDTHNGTSILSQASDGSLTKIMEIPKNMSEYERQQIGLQMDKLKLDEKKLHQSKVQLVQNKNGTVTAFSITPDGAQPIETFDSAGPKRNDLRAIVQKTDTEFNVLGFDPATGETKKVYSTPLTPKQAKPNEQRITQGVKYVLDSLGDVTLNVQDPQVLTNVQTMLRAQYPDVADEVMNRIINMPEYNLLGQSTKNPYAGGGGLSQSIPGAPQPTTPPQNAATQTDYSTMSKEQLESIIQTMMRMGKKRSDIVDHLRTKGAKI